MVRKEVCQNFHICENELTGSKYEVIAKFFDGDIDENANRTDNDTCNTYYKACKGR